MKTTNRNRTQWKGCYCCSLTELTTCETLKPEPVTRYLIESSQPTAKVVVFSGGSWGNRAGWKSLPRSHSQLAAHPKPGLQRPCSCHCTMSPWLSLREWRSRETEQGEAQRSQRSLAIEPESERRSPNSRQGVVFSLLLSHSCHLWNHQKTDETM